MMQQFKDNNLPFDDMVSLLPARWSGDEGENRKWLEIDQWLKYFWIFQSLITRPISRI